MLIERIRADRLAGDEGRGRSSRRICSARCSPPPPRTTSSRTTRRGPDHPLVREIARGDHGPCSRAAGLDTASQRAELAILGEYLPRTLAETELRASIAAIVAELPERSPKAMGQVMAALKARHGDALDSRAASASGPRGAG